MKITEKAPIEIEAKSGETPVNPAPKPIAKQLMPSMNPKKTVSIQVIFIVLSNVGSRISEAIFLKIAQISTNGKQERINQTHRTKIREPQAAMAIVWAK